MKHKRNEGYVIVSKSALSSPFFKNNVIKDKGDTICLSDLSTNGKHKNQHNNFSISVSKHCIFLSKHSIVESNTFMHYDVDKETAYETSIIARIQDKMSKQIKLQMSIVSHLQHMYSL